jgi:rod shape-determining protein MreD
MIELVLLFIVVYVLTVVQTVIAPAWAIGPIGPDLLAVTAVAWVLCRGKSHAVYVAALIGLTADLISPGLVGAGAAAFAVAVYLLLKIKSRLALGDVVSRTAAVCFVATLIAALTTAAAAVSGELTGDWSRVPLRCLGVGLYSAGVALPLFIAIGPWRTTGRRQLGNKSLAAASALRLPPSGRGRSPKCLRHWNI